MLGALGLSRTDSDHANVSRMVTPASKRPQTMPARIDQPQAESAPAAESTDVAAPIAAAPSWNKAAILAEGQAGALVTELQTLLARAGEDPGPIDGKFGPKTRDAVIAFQRVAHLKPDGLAGARTIDLLRSAPQPSDFKAAKAASSEATPSAPAAPAVAARGSVPAARASSPAAPTMADVAAPLSNVAPLISATAINPTEALKLIRNGDVDLKIPVKAGEILPGMLKASKDSMVHLSMHVKDGNIDFQNSKMTFDPPMTGPLGTVIRGVDMTDDGRAEVDVKYLPNATIGKPASAKLTDFIDQLGSAESLPVKMLGITIKKIPVSPSGAPPIDLKALASHIDVAHAKISVSNVTFQNGQIPFGTAGSARLGPESKVSIEGTLGDLTLTGHAQLQDLNLSANGTMIKGGKGTADIAVRLKADASLKGSVETRITNLQLQADYAVSHRANGDYLELARGSMKDASVTVTEEIGVPGAKPNTHLSIGTFEGTVNAGRVTIPDGDGTAHVTLGRTAVKGAVEVNGKHVMLSGDVDLVAQVDQYDSPGASANFKMTGVKLQGKAHASFDSDKGVDVNGNVHLTSSVESGKVTTGALKSTVLTGTIDADVTKFSLGAGVDGWLDIRGTTTVDFGFQNLDLKTTSGIALQGGAGKVTGKGDLRITNGGIEIANSKLRIKGAVEDGSIALGQNIKLDIKKGSTIDAVLTRAIFGATSEFDMTNMKVDATLDGGTVAIPGSQVLKFKDGAKVKFALDRLQVSKEGGTPKASGSIELQASIASKQIDLAALTTMPGISLNPLEGVDQTFKVKLGRFTIDKDGTFDVGNMSFGLDATVRHFGGRITP